MSEEDVIGSIVEVEDAGTETDRKKEQLRMLAHMGATKYFLDVNMDATKVEKLSEKEVDMYYARCQASIGRDLTTSLSKTAYELVGGLISRFVPIDKEALVEDWMNDPLLKLELAKIAGVGVLAGGALLVFGCAACKVLTHVKQEEPVWN